MNGSESTPSRERERDDPNPYGQVLVEKFSNREHGLPVKLNRPGWQAAIERTCVGRICDPDSAGSCLVQVELCTNYGGSLWMYRPIRDYALGSTATGLEVSTQSTVPMTVRGTGAARSDRVTRRSLANGDAFRFAGIAAWVLTQCLRASARAVSRRIGAVGPIQRRDHGLAAASCRAAGRTPRHCSTATLGTQSTARETKMAPIGVLRHPDKEETNP